MSISAHGSPLLSESGFSGFKDFQDFFPPPTQEAFLTPVLSPIVCSPWLFHAVNQEIVDVLFPKCPLEKGSNDHFGFKSKVHERMKTLRYQVFGVGGFLVKNGSERILKLSLAMKRRQWMKGLWENSASFENPVCYDS
jgi:hypothetical protein